jgi:cellulose synthase/poly-beta-1,6-N-acetylglucosamine synthase-like glycosyltransferase
MWVYKAGWAKQNDFIFPSDFKPSTFISVIIPARNEADNIRACISSILAQEYPQHLLEIIVVDDHSTDSTAAIVKEYNGLNVHCISLSDHLDAGKKIVAYKKAALAAGITQSRGSLIATTDADCIAHKLWLLNMAAIYEMERPAMIVAPVIYATDHSVVQIFQLIDFMSMQGITAAAHRLKLGNMSNGANLAFSKAAYMLVQGYKGIDHLASGDDLLLMVKMKKVKAGKISYLKSPEAIMLTKPQPDWKSFFRQRIRWASKSGKYGDHRLTFILLLVYLFNLAFPVLLVAGIFNADHLYIACMMFVIKVAAEYLFLEPVAKFFRKQWIFGSFFFLQPLHILYIIVAGFLGFVGGYEWKGRRVR